MENIKEYLQSIREIERLRCLQREYEDKHDVIAEIKEEFPIGTKLKQFDAYSRNAEVIGYDFGLNPEDYAFEVKSDVVLRGMVYIKRVEKLND